MIYCKRNWCYETREYLRQISVRGNRLMVWVLLNESTIAKILLILLNVLGSNASLVLSGWKVILVQSCESALVLSKSIVRSSRLLRGSNNSNAELTHLKRIHYNISISRQSSTRWIDTHRALLNVMVPYRRYWIFSCRVRIVPCHLDGIWGYPFAHLLNLLLTDTATDWVLMIAFWLLLILVHARLTFLYSSICN